MIGRVTRSRPGRAGSVLILLSVVLLAAVGVAYVAQPATAASVTPILVDPWSSGNAPTECNQATTHTGVTYAYAYKIDNWTASVGGVYNTGIAGQVITISNNDGTYFDWSALYAVGAVIVKGGNAANIFKYVPPAYSDTGMVSPNNPSGGPAAVSHATFCWNAGSPAPARLTVVKQTTPQLGEQSPEFPLQVGPGLTPAQLFLHDDESYAFIGIAPGPYTVFEGTVPPGWQFGSVTCVDDVTGGPVGTPSGQSVSVTLAAGQQVTCTFTNLRLARLRILKDAQPDDATAVFEFTPSANLPGGPTPFDLKDGQALQYANLGVGQTYTVGETGLMGGWQFDSVSCSNPPGMPAPDYTAVGPSVSVTLAAGDDVTCTFINTKVPPRPAKLTVVKETLPAGGAGFGFTTTNLGGAAFTLDHGGSRVFSDLAAGTYGVAEGTLPPGWQFDSVSCVDEQGAPFPDGDLPAAVSVTLAAGDDVTCTFTNTQIPTPRLGRIIVQKVTDPAGTPGSFLFDPSWGADFSLTHGGSASSPLLLPGPYSVHELLTPGQEAAGWSLASAECDDGSSPSAITLDAGETVTCTFVNIFEEVEGPKGSLTIFKVVEGVVNPADAGAFFSFDGGALGTFDLGDGESETFADLDAGSYTVAEGDLPVSANPPSNEPGSVGYEWGFDRVECTAASFSADGQSVTVNLAEGEAAVCTFYNYQQQVQGPELPYTGAEPYLLPLLIGGLWALVMGLALVVWSAMRTATVRR